MLVYDRYVLTSFFLVLYVHISWDYNPSMFACIVQVSLITLALSLSQNCILVACTPLEVAIWI